MELTKVYIAIQRGIYRHSIVGVYDTMKHAIDAGEYAILNEDDHYHDVEIVESELNSLGEKLVVYLKYDEKSKSIERRVT